MKKGKENNVFRRALSVLMAVMLCISSYTFQPMQVQQPSCRNTRSIRYRMR